MTKAELFREYESYHGDGRNRVCHAFGIPLILLGVLGLLHLVKIGPVDLAIVTSAIVLIYYATLDVRGTAISACIFALLYFVAGHLAWQINVATFIVGWIFQLIGHKFEGSKPKFLENFIYLLIGPLYIFDELFDAAVGSKRYT